MPHYLATLHLSRKNRLTFARHSPKTRLERRFTHLSRKNRLTFARHSPKTRLERRFTHLSRKNDPKSARQYAALQTVVPEMGEKWYDSGVKVALRAEKGSCRTGNG